VLLTPVVAVLAAASIGAGYENIALTRDQDAYAAPGQTYDVGGHLMHLDCHGAGGPTVVLFNGLGELTPYWARIAGPVAETTRVCAYDRPGQGWSADVDRPQDGIEAAADLHALLAAAGESGPYVLAGHSIGGPYALIFAERYPEQVAGVVLLDSSSPEQFTKVAAYAGQYAAMRRGLALVPTLNRLGLGRLLPASHLPGPAADQVDALSSTARAAGTGRDELSTLPDTFEQAQALTTLGDRPVAVLTASENVSDPGWVGAQDDLAALSTNHVQRTVQSTHMGLLEDAGPAAESVRAITDVIGAVRTGAPLPAA
jgi:pimeloyl-ACP methyl ester carboxylesterase